MDGAGGAAAGEGDEGEEGMKQKTADVVAKYRIPTREEYEALLSLAKKLRSELLHMCGHANFMPDEVAMLMSDSVWLGDA